MPGSDVCDWISWFVLMTYETISRSIFLEFIDPASGKGSQKSP